jgi:chorismate synthase
MTSNTLGKRFAITSFGESHGSLVGIVIDGCPAGLALTESDIQSELIRRKSGQMASTTRLEDDRAQILSGTHNGFTTGAPLTMVVWNQDVDSSPYGQTLKIPRPGHADYSAYVKYGGFADHRGGGRFSGRITAGFVMAGAVAKKLLSLAGMEIVAHTAELGGIKSRTMSINEMRAARKNELCCADVRALPKMLEAIHKARQAGDSLGGIIEVIATGVPAGLGEPVFDNLDGDIAKALFSIPAVKAVEFGAGFNASRLKGSQNNDPLLPVQGSVTCSSNNAGGIIGGISNGMPITVRTAIKPTPSIGITQDSVELDSLKPAKLDVKGRHDTCIVPRAVVVVEAMVAIIIADFAIGANLIPGVIK